MRVRKAMVGHAALALGLALAGCGGGSGARESWVDRLPLPQDTMGVAAEELGVHGGRFVVGATNSPKTFNPIMASETSSSEITQLLFISLTDVDYRTQEDIPMLARSWEITPDGRTVTFHLRRGACFSDGRPITSADVKFSFDVVMDPVLHPSMQDALIMEVGGKRLPFTYSAPDPHTFVMTAPGPDALLLPHIANVRIVPRHVLEPAARAGAFASSYTTATPPESLVTSGPFRVKSYLENQQTVLERNPYWFGVDGRGRRLPYLDEVVFRVAKDQNLAAQMFLAGELDGLDNVKPEDYRQYEADQEAKGYKLYDVGPHFNTNFFWFNLNRHREASRGKRPGDAKVDPHKFAWFSNREFRRAISHAIDRDAIVKGPFYGHAVVTRSIMTSGNARWYDSTLTAPGYDPARARALLDGLGLVDRNGDGVREDQAGRPVTFTMVYNADNKLRADMATLIQDDLARVGVRMVPSGLDFSTLVTRTRHDHQYEACLLGLGSAVPADPGMGPNFWKSTGNAHYWHVRQPPGRPDTPAEARIDALFEQHIGTQDLARRRATFHEMSQILNDEAFVIWLPTAILRIPVSSRFGNVHPSPMPHRILWNADRIFQKRAAGPS